MSIIPQKIASIYILKAICALFVVMYHVYMNCAELLIPLTCTAVPCFYMITGFFLYDKNTSRICTRSMQWAKKAFIITLFTNSLYAIFNSLSHIDFYVKTVVVLVFQGGVVAPHLWYLSALWESLLVFAVIRKFMPEKVVYILPLFFIISLLMSAYNFLLPEGVYSRWLYQSFLTVGMPCISLGYIVAKYKEKLSCFRHYDCLIVVGLILSFIEEYFINHIGGCYYIFTLPVSFCVFIVCVISSVPTCKWLEKIGEEHSANIYYYHMLVATVVAYVVNQIPELYEVMALVVYIASIVFSVIINKVCSQVRLLFSGRDLTRH